jgi:hypothetical protein
MPGARWFPGATLNYAHHLLIDHVGLARLAGAYPALTIPWEDAAARYYQLHKTAT